MKQQIVSRWNSSTVLFECELPDGLDSGMAMRHALEQAVKSDANLSDANLSGAYLSDAYLRGANLNGANLSGAYLRDANLSDANLSGANLSGAYLRDANLSDANLSGANLSGAYLRDANLSDAYLRDAKWNNGAPITRTPIQLSGLKWQVTIADAHMQIGCQFASLAEWAAFDDAEIAAMDGKDALRFWRAHKEFILGMARADGRAFEVVEVAA
jgi:uncharacterized protein YjbI with pentapeptide repeats